MSIQIIHVIYHVTFGKLQEMELKMYFSKFRMEEFIRTRYPKFAEMTPAAREITQTHIARLIKSYFRFE